MNKKDVGNGTIYFSNPDRLKADVLDTYNWLLLENKRLADNFIRKANYARKELDKIQKEFEKKKKENTIFTEVLKYDFENKEELKEPKKNKSK